MKVAKRVPSIDEMPELVRPEIAAAYRTSDLEQLYATAKLSPGSINVLHAVLHHALRIAVRDRLLATNPAEAVENRPRASKDRGAGARTHCWTPEETRLFLAAAKDAGAQASAFYGLAVQTGARKAELEGLKKSLKNA